MYPHSNTSATHHRYPNQVCKRGGGNTRVPLETRFWQFVQKSTDCWLWTGKLSKSGYGRIVSGGSVTKGAKTLRAHRVSWELAFGSIPDGLQVLHHCDNPRCVRPDHLFLGSHIDNMVDRNAKGHYPRGVRHPNAKLTDDAIREIRRLYAAGGFRQQDLADRYGVNQTLIGFIVRRIYWRHVEDAPPINKE